MRAYGSMSGMPAGKIPFSPGLFAPAGRLVMGGWLAWPLHTSPVYWDFCAARTPCQEVLYLNLIKPSWLLREPRLAAPSMGGRWGAGDLKRWEVGWCHVILYIPELGGLPSFSLRLRPPDQAIRLAAGLSSNGRFSAEPLRLLRQHRRC